MFLRVLHDDIAQTPIRTIEDLKGLGFEKRRKKEGRGGVWFYFTGISTTGPSLLLHMSKGRALDKFLVSRWGHMKNDHL